MSKIMNQSPRCHVARFVSECMQFRETKPDLSRQFVDYRDNLFPLMVVADGAVDKFICLPWYIFLCSRSND